MPCEIMESDVYIFFTVQIDSRINKQSENGHVRLRMNSSPLVVQMEILVKKKILFFTKVILLTCKRW